MSNKWWSLNSFFCTFKILQIVKSAKVIMVIGKRQERLPKRRQIDGNPKIAQWNNTQLSKKKLFQFQ